jgi:hypothetical protein
MPMPGTRYRFIIFLMAILLAISVLPRTHSEAAGTDDVVQPAAHKPLYPINAGEKGWGVLDLKGNWAIAPDPAIGLIYSFHEGLTLYLTDGLLGIMDENGRKLTEPRYLGGSHFSNGIALIRSQSGADYYVNREGRVVYGPVDPFYDGYGGQPFREGLAAVYDEDKRKWGFIDTAGTIAIQPIYESVESFSEGLANVLYNGKWGFIDKKGKFVIPPKYRMGGISFSEGLAPFYTWTREDRSDFRYGVIDRTGKTVIPATFAYIGNFSNGLAIATNSKGTHGLINSSGKYVILLKYDYTFGSFSSRLLQVGVVEEPSKLMKYGYINSQGQAVIKPQFDEAMPFDKHGIARVRIGKKIGYIRSDGTYLWKPTTSWLFGY